jgi:tetratricopeptide (TPR) repeat protein
MGRFAYFEAVDPSSLPFHDMKLTRIPAYLLAAVCSTALTTAAFSQDPLPTPTPTPQVQEVPTMAEATQLMREAKWEEAAVAFGSIALADQDNGVAWLNLGYCLHANGDLDRALRVHHKAATFETYQGTALYNIGCVHALQGNADRAFEYLNKALAASPIAAAQFKNDTDLTSLHKDARWGKLMAKLDPKAKAKAKAKVKATPLPKSKEASAAKAAKAEKPKYGKAIALAKLPAERRFDFWIGEWDMSVNGELISHQSVKSQLDGASIVQTGPNSMTLAVFDPTTSKWKMTWTSTAGHHDVLIGGMNDQGQMVMHQNELRDRPGVIGKWILRDIYKNHFFADWVTSTDDGKTWVNEAAMEYKRTPKKAKAAKDAKGKATKAAKAKDSKVKAAKTKQAKSIAGMSKDAPPQTRQYAFMLGDWKIEAEAMKPDQTGTTGSGHLRVAFADDGVTLVEDMLLKLDGLGEFEGQNRRVFNPDAGQWDVRWTPKGQDATFEIVGKMVDGKMVDGKMVEYSGGNDQHGAYKDTVHYTDIKKNSFKVWMDRVYTDSGHKIEGLYHATMTRVK